MAYRGQVSAIATMRSMMPKDDKGKIIEDPYTKIDGRPTQATVEKAIGLNGAVAKLRDDGVVQYATYNWRGLFRTYHVNAYYSKDPTPVLMQFSTE